MAKDCFSILYLCYHPEPLTALESLGVTKAAIKNYCSLPATPFSIFYGASLNSRIYDADTAARLKKSETVFAAQVVMDHLPTNPGDDLVVVAAGPLPEWSTVLRLLALCTRYSELEEDMRKTEDKCLSLGEGSVRRRDLLESYEYIDSEMTKLEELLKQVYLID